MTHKSCPMHLGFELVCLTDKVLSILLYNTYLHRLRDSSLRASRSAQNDNTFAMSFRASNVDLHSNSILRRGIPVFVLKKTPNSKQRIIASLIQFLTSQFTMHTLVASKGFRLK
jgi:hypothetical protein